MLAGVIGCNPVTTRPAFMPLPDAWLLQLELPVPAATRALADQLRADSIPVTLVEESDGWLDSGWFSATTGEPLKNPGPGPDAVRVRGWLDPWQPGESTARVEGVWRPLSDPSLPPRELEKPLPAEHPVGVRLRRAVDSLRARYGHVEPDR